MPQFNRYIGIDYSGAQTPGQSLKGLRVYIGDCSSVPSEVEPPPSPRKYWTRQGIAEWLVARLAEDEKTIVGIDHGFSFPVKYFYVYGLSGKWDEFLDDFRAYWPTDDENMYVDFVRDGLFGNGAARVGSARWKRLTELRTGRAKSVFHFDVNGSVAKSTHAGLPWLRYIRQHVGSRVHFWPFDGWVNPEGKSAVVEVYPALWNQGFALEGRNSHQHDAYTVSAWMRERDLDGSLQRFFSPGLSSGERDIAGVEGWIFGVM